ncbi:hypothetical protein GCM10010909_14490 [Acidocella aquatica]|uniref:Glycosyltransferase RgtA/B/C/D-like domain-containing protein n=1 Tax=Acidocella aquatica TaxID=1922313 RepID=A0ABQ6A3M0_9PROT|nr:hypothetical protein [Acidocella aquatica]GLR66769.1 hypothetical protein GCM10010909_14490 [Acidocella aquatica]
MPDPVWKNAWKWHIFALALYTALAAVFIGLGASITKTIYGHSNDPFIFIWFFSWWPWALAHHLNPFFTQLIWQPTGLNLAWTTNVPFLALLAAPLTFLSGPVFAYNVLTLAAPALAAWAAYFLCLYVSRVPGAALLGGYLFGFSSYQMAHTGLHLNLTFTALIPCLLLLALLRLDGRISRWPAILGAAFLVAGQFAISAELLATTLMFGAITWALAYWHFPVRRLPLQHLAGEGVLAGLFAAMLVSPLLWGMFSRPRGIQLPPHWPLVFVTDPLNLIVPTIVTALGGSWALPLTRHFSGLLDEQGAYLGLPLLFILWGYCRAHSRFFGLLLGVIILLSCGPQLRLAGVVTHIPLPWALLRHLPFIGMALPARFMLYASLAGALIAALWIAESPSGQPRRLRLLAGLLASVILLPAPHGGQPVPSSSFFAPGHVQGALGNNKRLLILPFGIMGPSSFWQQESRFSFAQTGGYLGFPPAAIQSDKPILWFYFGLDYPGFTPDFIRFCQSTHTDFVVAGPGTSAHAMAQMQALDWRAQKIDDVTVFTVPAP